MSDERDITENIDDIIESIGEVVYTPGDIVLDNNDEGFFSAEIKSLEDALRLVDSSNLPPAPVSSRPDISDLPDIYNVPDLPAKPDRYTDYGQEPDNVNLPVKRSPSIPAQENKTIVPLRSSIAALIPAVFKKQPDFDLKDTADPRKTDKGQKEFKISFDFESAYKDPPENRPLRRRRERRTGLIGGVMYAVFILCIGLVLASVLWMFTIDVLGFAAGDEPVDIQVPENFTMEGITDALYDAGLIKYKMLFNLFAGYSNAEDKIAPGSYVLNMNYDYRALVQGMTERAGVRVETTVTIPEGYTLSRIFNLLEDEEVCSAEELWEAATHHDFNFYFLEKETLGDRLRLEGFLFPDTYNFYKESSPIQVLTRMLRQFDNKFTEQYVERADYLGYTVREIVIIASMIEREAGNDEERPRIAAVIYNRLHNPDNYPMLEIDATFYYAVAGTSIPPSPYVESVFNTYLYPGLPPGPISSPGLASIQAALYPSTTNEYFYALNKNGTHNFFTNAADHRNFVNSDDFGG